MTVRRRDCCRLFFSVGIGAVWLTGLLGSACGGDAETSTPPSPTPSVSTADQATVCGEPSTGVDRVAFTDADGAEVDGIVVGSGALGVVLAHQRNSDLCSWLPFARSLDPERFRALAFTFAGDLEANVVAAADYLRARGAGTVVLIGASMGGTASLVAATVVRPSVEAVVAVSAPREFSGLDAERAVRRLAVPLLFVAGREDTAFAADARVLFRAARSSEKQLLLAEDFAHGTDLLDGPEGPRVRREILGFLTR